MAKRTLLEEIEKEVYEVPEEEYIKLKQEDIVFDDVFHVECETLGEVLVELAYQGFTDTEIHRLSKARYGNVIEIRRVTSEDGTIRYGLAIGAR